MDDRLTALATVTRRRWTDTTRAHYLIVATIASNRPLPTARVASWDGGPDDFGRELPSVWPELAEFLLQHGCCDPHEFCFSQSSSRGILAPHLLRTSDALDRYRRQQASGRFALQLSSQRTEFEIACNRVVDWNRVAALPPPDADALCRSVLYDEHIALSTLFRHCAAEAQGLGELAARFRLGALFQLLPSLVEYARDWKVVLPPDLLADATALRAHFSTG